MILSAVCLLAFVLLSKYEDRPILRNLDFSVTVKVQDRITQACATRCDGILENIGLFASPMVSIVTVLGITGFLFLLVKGTKKKIAILCIPLVFGLLTLVEIYGKTVVRHPAPPFFMLKNPTTIFPTYYINELYTYPSGHAARAVFVAILASSVILQVTGKSKRKKQIVFFVAVTYVFIVSLGKIYLGQHWFSDVAGGLLLGAGMALFSIGFL